jgi:four helix bundle protein
MSQCPQEQNDLEQRVARFGVNVCRSARQVRIDAVTQYITWQLVRSATSPAANYAEARAAESRRDFVHKMQICLKEFRETAVWLEYLSELAGDNVDRSAISQECDELTRIFVASIRTAREG